MRKFSLFALLGMFVFLSVKAEKIIVGNDANTIFSGAEVVRYKDNVVNPVYIQFAENKGPNLTEIENWLVQNFNLTEAFTFEYNKEEEDNLGWKHLTLVQKFQDIPVEFAGIKVHVKNGTVHSINGYSKHHGAQKSHQLSEQLALEKAISHVGAQKYLWQIPEEEAMLKAETNNPEATFFPKGEKVFVPEHVSFKIGNLNPSWKFDIYAQNPPSRADIYVDAVTGEILFENRTLLHVDSMGTAHTSFSGQRDITADYISNGNYFRLRENGRGNGVITLDAINGTSLSASIDFVDTDNVWLDTLRISYATDAHWGAEMSYDYLNNVHGRNSLDGNGFALRSYVHWDQNWANASWDGQRMRYGDGNSSSKPFTTLDICGHEFSHGVTSNTAALIYSYESGALNESFSDIFGNCIEYYSKPDPVKNWLVGEDRGNHLRSMSNPKTRNDPDTYEGDFWAVGSTDNGGVHTNSGVQNHWFYLLSVGGSGTNDNNESFTVTGIGIPKAEAIAFRNLTVYLSRSSDYEDARFYSIVAAKDIYGACTPELASNVAAWHAVGVGDAYQANVVSAFKVDKKSACTWPEIFYFKNESNFYNVQSFTWDFGDMSTSSVQDPSHTYAAPGTYTVTLTANGGACGTDVETKTDYISIVGPADVTASDATNCDGYPAILSANANDVAYWYDSPTSPNPVYVGNPFKTQPLFADQTFYVENVIQGPNGKVGPDTIVGFGEYFSGYQYLVFDVHQEMTLKSVKVFAGSTKGRIIELRDESGAVLQSKAVTVVKGTRRVNLDFVIAPGENYQLGVPFNSSADFWRNSTGPKYPYKIDELVTIQKSSAGTAPLNYYYYFYDWDVAAKECKGKRIPVLAKVDLDEGCVPILGIGDEIKKENSVEVFPNPALNQFKINLDLIRSQQVSIGLYDLNGRLAKTIGNSTLNSGLQSIEVNVADLSRGFYMIRLNGEDFSHTERLILSE